MNPAGGKEIWHHVIIYSLQHKSNASHNYIHLTELGKETETIISILFTMYLHFTLLHYTPPPFINQADQEA